jgi:hypothetical protein
LRSGNPFNLQFNFELSAAIEKQWHGDFGAYGIRTRDLLNAIEALYQLS